MFPCHILTCGRTKSPHIDQQFLFSATSNQLTSNNKWYSSHDGFQQNKIHDDAVYLHHYTMMTDNNFTYCSHKIHTVHMPLKNRQNRGKKQRIYTIHCISSN